MYIYKVGVVGAGTMGAQIAQVMTYAGLPVVLTDVTIDIAQQGIETIRRIYQARVDKGKMTRDELEKKMLLVTPAESFRAFTDADLVIEAVSENLSLKQRVLAELDQVCPPGTILATNTSALLVSAIASATRRPGKVLGLHFFNPAYAMPLVEIIPGLATDAETVNDAVGFVDSIRKLPIAVKECAGFLVNRVLMAYLNEAVLCLEDGTSSMKEIEQDMREFGMPMGPFALLDSVGLDIAYDVAGILYESYGPRLAPASLLGALVKVGRLGQKNDHGFYEYGGPETGTVDHLLAEVQQAKSGVRTPWNRNRLLLIMINEAVMALQEGIASAHDIDQAMMAGIGFPLDKQGPLHYADSVGIDVVLETLQQYTRILGARFWPAPLLRRMVAAHFTGKQVKRGFFTY